MNAASAITPMQYEVVKHVTLPLLKIPEDGSPVYISVDEAIIQAEKIETTRRARTVDPGEAPKVEKAPPELMRVTNLETRQPMQMIANAVLASQLRKTYPSDGYVGKMFQIRRFKIATGKLYATFEILEVRPKQQAETPKLVAGKK